MAGKIFQFLAISMFVAVPANTVGWIYISLGRTRQMFRWSLVSTLAIVAGFFVGLPFGASRLALAYSVVVWIITIPCLAFAAHRSLVSVAAMLRVIVVPTAVGIVSTIAGLGWHSVHTSATVTTDLLEIAGATGSAYAVGAATILMLDPALLTLRTRVIAWVSTSMMVCLRTVRGK